MTRLAACRRILGIALPAIGVLCGLVVWDSVPAMAQGTTVQLPTFGVAVDAEGVLKVKTFTDPTGQLRAERLRAAKALLAADLTARTRLRKVSLIRLEATIRKTLDQGKKPDDAMRYLAGLQRLQYVFFYPHETDRPGPGGAAGQTAKLF
jgi:hypothetical protein